MPINKMVYAASAPLTITLTGLPRASARASQFVENVTNLYTDAHVSVKFTPALVTPKPPGDQFSIYIYAYGMEDGLVYGPSGGPTAKEAIDGTDKAIVMNFAPGPSTLWGGRIGIVAVHDAVSDVQYVSPPLSVAQAFGGSLPRQWGIVVENRGQYPFAATGCSASYSGIYSTT